MIITNRLVLIGFRGAGKSTIGKKMSQMLRWSYFSTDEMIESQIKMSIGSFVAKEGWPSFREIESKIIENLENVPDAVIDTGGGVVENVQNMQRLTQQSFTVWVDAATEDIYQRLLEKNDRPLLSRDDLREDIEINYQRREKLYRKYSQMYVNTSQDSSDSICQYIYENFR